MRLAVLASGLLSACSFSPGKLFVGGSSDDAGGGGTGIDGALIDGSLVDSAPIDAMADASADASVSPIKTRPITIGTVTGGPHASFPVLISITAPWLRTVPMGSVASLMGHDIGFFADSAGTTRLDHEVESYSTSTTSGTILAWVKVPSVNTGTVIYMRYGDPTIVTSQEDVPGVWSASYAAVWHLGNLTDSVATSDGTANGAVATGSGKISGAYSFDGSNDEVDVGSASGIDDLFAGGGTAEAWFYADSFGGNSRGRIFDKEAFTTGSSIDGWTLHLYNGNVTNCVRLMHGSSSGYGTWASPANSVSTGAWYHVAVVYNRDNINNDPTTSGPARRWTAGGMAASTTSGSTTTRWAKQRSPRSMRVRDGARTR